MCDRFNNRAAVDRRDFLKSMIAVPLLPALGSRVAQSRARDHVVVVGAGVFGGWTALSLLRAGARVTLMDAWGAGHSRASSGGETRVIRAVYNGEAVYTRMVARALTLWRGAEQQWRRQVFFPAGALWMFESDDGYASRSIAPMKAAGLSLHPVSPADAERRYPQMSFRGVRSIFLEPGAGYLLARQACELVRETFVREGGTFEIAAVRAPAARGGRLSAITLADGRRLEADRFVFACGPWLGELFPEVVGRRIVATRQEVFFFGVPPGDRRYDTLPTWVHMGDRVVYGVPGNDRRGLKIADDTAGDEVNPTTLDRTPSAAGLARARVILRARFPALSNAPLLEARVCQYEASSDGNFLADRHPTVENAWLVGGGSGHGFKMGPALGEHVASLVMGREPANPLFAYGRLLPRPPAR